MSMLRSQFCAPFLLFGTLYKYQSKLFCLVNQCPSLYLFGLIFCSIKVVEGTVQNLIEDNDVVTGVRYKERGNDESKVTL